MTVRTLPQLPEGDLSTPASTLHSRRRLMKLAAIGGISMAAMKFFTPSGALAASPALTGGPTDGDTQFAGIPGSSINEKVLNFALTLEILEADLYRQALNLASNLPIGNDLNPNPKAYTLKNGGGGLPEAATQVGYLYLKQFAYVEAAHRDFLNAAIKAAGFTPVTRNPGGYAFVSFPKANIKSLLNAILPLEETGTRAYLGALPYLTDLGLATVAGGIYSTECRHSAVINNTLGLNAGPERLSGDLEVVANPPAGNTFEPYLQPATVLKAASVYFVK
jgi:hypothetical protein